MKNTLLLVSIFLLSYCASFAQPYDVTLNSTNTVASIVMPLTDYNNWITNDEFSNDTRRAAVVNEIYKKFNDEFDIVFFVLNESNVPSNYTYAGMNAPVSNKIAGIGKSIYSNAADYGSRGKLKSVIFFPEKDYITGGPSLHEILHNWANTAFQTTNSGHWGVTGGSGKGQIGGFVQSTLQTGVDGIATRYKVGSFGEFANGGNGIPYTQLELYMMGMIPVTDVSNFDIFNGVTYISDDGTNATFEATSRKSYTPAQIVSDLGERIPSSSTSQKDFRVLFVVLSNATLSPTEFASYETQVNEFTKTADDGYAWKYNFWEATGGRGTLKADQLDKMLINKTAIVVTSQNSIGSVYRNTACPITWTNTIGGNVKIELYQNGDFQQTIASSVAASSGSYSWNIPNDITMGDKFWIKITSLDDQTIYAYNSSPFSISMQQFTISGKVLDNTGIGVSNATVSIGMPIVKDQSQETAQNYIQISESQAVWQSFTPTASTISKVDVYLYKQGSPKDLSVSIKDINGIPLWTTTINKDSIATGASWLSVSIIPALTITPNQMYYISLSNSFVDNNNSYGWVAGYSSYYTGGNANLSGWDFCFREWSGDGASTTTNTSGFYSFNVTDGWSGSLTSTAFGEIFSKALVITNVNGNKVDQNIIENDTVSVAKYAGSTATANVTVNTSWTASSDQSWLQVTQSSNSGLGLMTFTATALNYGKPRIAIVKVLSTNGITTQYFTVTQAPGVLYRGDLSPLVLSSMDATAPIVDQNSITMVSSDEYYGYFRFKPTVSGSYTFSLDNPNSYASLFNSNGQSLSAYDNSTFSNNLIAGQLYYYEVYNVVNPNLNVTVNITGGGLESFIYTGTGAVSDLANWNWGVLPTAYNNATIKGNLTINQDITVTDFTISPNASVTINSGEKCNYVNLYLKSDATGSASFISDIVGMPASVEQYLTGSGTTIPNDRFWYISSPVTGATSATFDAAGANLLKRYDEPSHVWSEITDNTTTLAVGTGYFTRLGTTTTSLFTGALNTGNINLSLSRSGTSDSKRGYNLIGNPYPSYLDWNAAYTASSNLDPTMWYRTNNGSVMIFDTYNATSKVGTNNNLKAKVTNYIPPMQAFWVQVTIDGTTGTVGFTNSMRSHQSGDQLKAEAVNDLIRLKVANVINSDETILVFNTNAHNGLDAFDSEKMFNTDASIPELYTIADAQKLVINGLESAVSNPVIPLGFKTTKAGTYTITANEIEGLDGIPVLLEDKLLNKTQDLTQTQSYSFTSDSVDNANRFVLHLKSSTIDNITEQKSSIHVYSKSQSIVVATSESKGNVFVSDVLGRTIAAQTIVGTQTIIEVPTGVYFVKVQTSMASITKQVVIE
jgi:hypothetical protein